MHAIPPDPVVVPTPETRMNARMKFGLFLAPFHQLGEHPTLALDRDLELIRWVDQLGFDEAWVGEHHTTGWETISSPEMFLAVAAERTKHIRLGTGAVSLPYHHPLMVADRIVLLDHLTRGRINFGVGPGGHISDAVMLGLDPGLLRDRMAESLEVIVRLFSDPTPFSYTGSWFEMHDAVLQLRPYQDPHPPLAVTSLESPAGMRLAGRFGCGVLSLSAARPGAGGADLATQWAHAEDAAAQAGRTVHRRDWRLSLPVHIAETRDQAIRETSEGGARFLLDYVEATTGRPCPVDGPREDLVRRMAERGSWVVGSPDDLLETIAVLQETTGGFGTLLFWANEWAPWPAVKRSYELIARYVIPEVQGLLAGARSSNMVARDQATRLHQLRAEATARATESAGGPAGH